jgi:hypothetical protein
MLLASLRNSLEGRYIRVTSWYRLLNRHAPIDGRFADRLSAFVLDPSATRDR